MRIKYSMRLNVILREAIGSNSTLLAALPCKSAASSFALQSLEAVQVDSR
jgi:hypothetical protein